MVTWLPDVRVVALYRGKGFTTLYKLLPSPIITRHPSPITYSRFAPLPSQQDLCCSSLATVCCSVARTDAALVLFVVVSRHWLSPTVHPEQAPEGR
jgi:hypothetical protein